VFTFGHLPADHSSIYFLIHCSSHPTTTLNVDKGTFHIFTELRGKERQSHLSVQALVPVRRKVRKERHTTDIAECDSDAE
jgi:hypothetical protein